MERNFDQLTEMQILEMLNENALLVTAPFVCPPVHVVFSKV